MDEVLHSSWIPAPVDSLIDTTVQKLGLRTESAGEDGGVGEKTVRVSRCHLAQLQLGDLQFEDLEAEVFPGSDSGNVFGTKPVDGIVGLEVFLSTSLSDMTTFARS